MAYNKLRGHRTRLRGNFGPTAMQLAGARQAAKTRKEGRSKDE